MKFENVKNHQSQIGGMSNQQHKSMVFDTQNSINDHRFLSTTEFHTTTNHRLMKFCCLKINSEHIFLTIIFVLFLWLGYGNLSDHKISHDTLIGYLSADAVQDAGWVEGIIETGNFKYFPAYLSAGFNDTMSWYAPAVFHTSAMLSYMSGLEAYDSLIFLAYFFAVVSALIVYFIIRDYNKDIAIISVPFMLYIFFGKFYNGLLLGQWGYTIGSMFVIASFWAITKLSEDKSYFLLGLFVAGNIFTHPSELAFIIGFIVIYLAYNFIAKNIKFDSFKKIIFAGITAGIIASYFILILYISALPEHTKFGGGMFNLSQPISEHYGYPGVYLEFFGLSLIFMVLGMLLSLKHLKKMHPSILMGFFMLLVGFSNYLGGSIGDRAFQNRFFWPLYLAVFCGLAVYFLLKIFIKEFKHIYSICISIFILIILIAVNYQAPGPYSLIEKERLDGLRWFHDHSKQDAEIFFFYGDPYSQTSILWLTKRNHYLVNFDYFIGALNEKKIKREYLSRCTYGQLFHRTSFLSAGNYASEYGSDYFFKKRDICNYDYLVFDKASSQPVLAQYNMLIASKLLENENIKIAFSNSIMLILKNEKPGSDCIEEQSIA